MKKELEALSSIARIHVVRTPLNIVGGCTWTVSFLEDVSRLHRGDMPELVAHSLLTGTSGESPSIVVTEERKGTVKEVQTITVHGGDGGNVDLASSFKLRFEGEETGDILALPLGGNTCLGSTKAKQIITTSTVDTSGAGGDDSVSHLTTFALIYEGHITSNILANGASCEDTSALIEQELMKLPPLYEVSVSGSDTDAGDEGCAWEVTFLSVMGSPELMTLTSSNGKLSAGPSHSVTVGDANSVIQDTITISQPEGFEGDVNLIQSELSKLSTIGIVTVTPTSAVPDEYGQCTWQITFESKAGNTPSLQVARGGTSVFSTEAELNSGNRVVVTDDTARGTSVPVSGDFRLIFDGELTGYMPHDASSDLIKSSLDALPNIGDVAVTRIGPDVNGCYSWDVTFISDLGPLPRLLVDDLDLTGTVASMAVSKTIVGALPPFNGPDYGSALVSDTDVSVLIPKLKQGIPYYVRISAMNAVGTSPFIMPYPPVEIPLPRPPKSPSSVLLEAKDGSTLAVAIYSPFHDGGRAITSYRVDYSTQQFVQERQRIGLTCSPQPAIQTVTTSATDIDEVQFLIIDSSYGGDGEVQEVQRVMCDATGGTFGLSFGGETAYIAHDADSNEIKESLEYLSAINDVNVDFNNDKASACAPFDGTSAGDFSITFQSVVGMSGDLPLMTAESSGLEGARHVVVTTDVDGDAPLSGSLKLSFRGAMSKAIDISLASNDLAIAIELALEELDTIQQGGVVVEAEDLANGGYEKVFSITFTGSGVGGNVEALLVAPEHLSVTGSSANAFILSDGESYAARNAVETFTSVPGNVISGFFQLRLRGHTTRRISFNSSVDEMKARLEELPNIGLVDVQMSGPSMEMAYTWTIHFISNPGYFPPSARIVDDLQVINELSTLVPFDDSATITVSTVRIGHARLEGQFQLTYDDGKIAATTRPLQSFISADDLKMELEALPNIGHVTVKRSESLVGYEWDVEFTSCTQKNGLDVCNDGNLLPLVASNINLQGCGGPALAVTELAEGRGASSCAHLNSGLCFDEESFDGEYPIHHDIQGLDLGTPYFVQVRLRNSQSYGFRQLATPLYATPQHNAPGAPPPVVLIASTSTSITVGWEKPTVNGGQIVSGYELWMDAWSGGEPSLVYDGAGSPNVMEFGLTTRDLGSHSQVVETGRQYRFQVRAINNCDTKDSSRSCFGEFSEVQVFTVRDPRAPLPPSMPQRDSETQVTSLNQAIISISWAPPTDNGGSPITGYILFMKDHGGTMTSYALDREITKWQIQSLRPGEVYRFHVVAANAFGKSGNGPVLSTLAAMHPGLSYDGSPEYSTMKYRPLITDVQETALTVKWSHLPADISGGTPIIGFKLYLYEYAYPLVHSDADYIKEEVQHIVISAQGQDVISGTFTASFRGYETSHIAVDADAETLRTELENLPSINLVQVDSIANGWSVAFLSEAGDLPLIQVTTGRVSNGVKIAVTEATKGDAATLVYDGSDIPGQRTFEALDLTPDTGYAFKVAPVNAVGDGVLSAASIVTIARAGASASRTTASGSSLSKGIAGSIQEEQVITFLSGDCISDKLFLSFELADQTGNLCGSSADEMEAAIEELGAGNVHVSREESSSSSGHSGYSWSVTFLSRTGDVPLLTVDRSQVGNGRDALGMLGLDGIYVTEFLKGQSNEFVIEPKKASGAVIRDLSSYAGVKSGDDIFFTELWTSSASVIDGSHSWYSDGGVSSYNPVLYIEQIIAIPTDIDTFHLSMDTSETQPLGRIDGTYARTQDITSVSKLALEVALAKLPNVGKVHVSQTNADHESTKFFIVTFRDVFGEYPLLAASDPSIMISLNDGHISATEVQTLTLSADKPFVYEVQSVSISSNVELFYLSYKAGRTKTIPCNFQSISEAEDAVSSIEAELNSLPHVKVRVGTVVTGTGQEGSPWKFRITFLEPVGPLPLLTSDNAIIVQEVQGGSTLAGSVVLSYEGEYSEDIQFDASAKDIKDKLQMLSTIEEVNVRKYDMYTGYQWVVTFTGQAGNIPLLVAHSNVFEIQSIQTSGGIPTPLGGSFTLSYLSEETGPLPFDSSADLIKSSLESLSSITRVDVSREIFNYGQAKWLVTFRLPNTPALLIVNSTNISGTLDDAVVSIEVDSLSPSLVAAVGSPPMIIVEEKVPGLPSYTGHYRANSTGNYSLAVLHLEGGGLNAKYYDNQWLLDEPVIERVDPTINFNWGSNIVTQFGRDYVSIRWWGKVRPLTSEPYNFYLDADDGVRLYVDHKLIIDMWEPNSVEKKATAELTAGSYHDLKIEYKELTGDAYVRLEWSSRSLRKQIIPPSQLFYPSHIVGSPFQTTVSPGAADYPHSTFIDTVDQNRSEAVAGERSTFYLQARDSSGNDKLTNGDDQGDMQSPEEQFTVDIVAHSGSVSGIVTYLENGKYRVDYNVLKAGSYQVHVKTGGTDIYCGLGEENKCSPFILTVLPGATLASNCEVESSFDPVDSLVEARAGDIGKVYVQAKDAFGNNRIVGGDEVVARFASVANPDIQYRGNVVDREDGTYLVTYSIPLAGSFLVSVTLGGESVQYCVGPHGERWHSRQYDGTSVYSSPSFCSLDDELYLHVIHRELHGVSTTLAEEDGLSVLTNAVVGVETGFIVEARDKFGNLRTGSSTPNLGASGDGMSDAFLVSFIGPNGNAVVTSTSVEFLTCLDSSVTGYFRISYGGKVTPDIPHDFSAAAMQVILSSLHDSGANSSSVQVSRSTVNGNYQWKITFVDHLKLWSQYPLSVLPGSDGFRDVSDLLLVERQPSTGIYPVRFTLWDKGTYELSVFSGSTLVSGSSYTIEVTNGAPQASSSSAVGRGLETGVAGEESSFLVQVRDQRQSEIQSILTSAVVIDFIQEEQRLKVVSDIGESFRIEFRGQTTSLIEVGLSTLSDVADAIEALPTIGQVSVSSDGVSSIITKGDNIDIVFLTEHGNLDLLTSTGPEIIREMVQGEAPYRAERQSIFCNALGGYVVLSFKDSTATIEFDDEIDTVASKLSALVGEPVAIVKSDDSIASICSNDAAKVVFVDFPLTLGNLEALDVSISALEPADGYMTVFGNGEEDHGAVNGINLIMGYYRLVYEGESTIPISADASAEEVKVALDNLPSIGSVGVTKEMFGLRLGMDGQNVYPGKASLFTIWTITFADDSKDGCEPGFWDKCPANIGDLPSLMIDPTLLTYEIGATQQQLSPKIKIFEVKKGSTGNTIDSGSPADIEFSLSHNLIPDVGIELHEVHTLSCSYSTEALVEGENEGSFELIILNKNIIIDALTPLHELALILLEALDLTHPVTTAGSTHETVCHFDPSDPVTAVSKLTFSREDGPIPSLYVRSEQSVMVAVDNLINAVDSVKYLGGGRYNVTYTPTVSGHYSASIKVNDKSIWSDISTGVFVDPADASAHYCTHDSDLVAVTGKEESFDVVARDRFGNKLSSTMTNGTSLVLSLNGVSDACIGSPRNDRPNVLVEVLETGHPDGHYKVAYTPILAGTYESSIMLRSRGGLLATYFKNQDFTEPVYGNDYHNSIPYHETPWCAADKPVCDSTRLDTDISFDWGFDSPVLSDPSFPMDSFSARWEGEIKVDKTDNYTFSCLFNGGIRLTVGGRVLIDSLIDTNTESLSSTPVILKDGVLHSIKVEYVHFTDEARMQLFWRSSSMPRQNVPSHTFYYTRHIGGSSLSPFSIHVSPGEIDTSSSAEGDGLLSCVAMAECSFVIQTKDANHNNRYTYGSDPGFEIDLRGNSGWAAEGRVNGVVTLSSPVVVSGATVTSNDWRYIGEADAFHLSSRLATKSNFMGILLRGDNIAIDGIMYTVSPTGKFDATSIPLLSPYLGPTKQVAVFKASKVCQSGTHTVRYSPSVRGSYLMDVRLPTVKEVQRVTTSTHSHSSLSGAFTLTYHGEVEAAPLASGSIEFDASSDEFRMALESIETIGSVDVSRHECDYPSISCSWDVTFLSLEGDVHMLVSSKIHLGGEVSEIKVDEIVQGRRPKSIDGFPRTIAVSPGETSPSRTTAYGKGLVSVTAGDKATFVIQPKDSFGNDRLADQKEDLFGVFIFPEQANVDGLFPITKGTLNRANEGFFMVEYTPKTSGWHTVAVVQAVSPKRQQITTGYTSKSRGGAFTIELGNLSTLPISWDANEEALKNALDLSMEGISSFDVQKHTHGLFNFKYVISYVSLLGDVPDFSVDTSNIIGSTIEWDIASLSLGKFAHIKVDDEPNYEIQSINLKVIDQSMLDGAKFSLTFMGQRTDPIPWNANVNELKQKLEVLSTVGDIIVSLEADEINRLWKVTFNPYEGKSPNSLVNFGNLSPLQTSLIDASIYVEVETIEDGSSPYRVWVKPSGTASSKITAYDHGGVPHFEGLTTGVYKTDSHFFVQSRDEFSNAIQDGPLKEVQIIQTSSSSQIGGFFEISMYGKTVRIEASAFTSELEKHLQSIPGIGSVTVTSNSAKDLVVGKTISVTTGLSVVTPSVMLSEFTIGDWIRIGDQDGGQLFSITDMAKVTPFTITLSSPYLGKSDPSAKIYQHGLPHNRLGYQYIVSFDAVLGDLPSLTVDGALLDGDNANVGIVSCDWNIHQRLDILPTSVVSIGGYFYLVYKNEQTQVLSVDVSAEELQNAIVTDIAAIETVLVTHLDDSDSFAIHLMSFEGDAELFFVEGHMLIGGTIVMTPTCPVDSYDRPLYSVESVAGRRGDDFVITLDGSANTTVLGTIENIEGGRYLATYNPPRVGTYSLSIQAAHAGGLVGEYYNNRWLYGSPTLTRVDESIDFQWNNNETVTTTGKDFISIRWTGYIKPVFDEIYTFTAHVNDALRLWVGSELLIDEFEHEVNDTDKYVVFSATTIDILKADQLVEIKVEFRENRGQGMIKLFWESISQPFAIIDQPRMYYNASHIHGSPFRVSPQAIKPSSPTLCSVEIAGWNSLRISWAPPGDDGGIHSNTYLVESWDASNYGTTEKQQLRTPITGEMYFVSFNSHQIKIPVGASALEVEKLIQSIPIIGDVKVLKSIEGEVNVYDVEFLTNNAPIPTINIDTLAATPESERSQFCVCAKGSETCASSGSQSMSCNPDASREGSVNTDSYEVEVANNASIFSYTIGGLDQTSDILDGFGVRVSAKNTQGLSIPCPSLFLKPYSPPLPPAVIELERVASNPSSLAVHFTSVTSPHDKGSIVSSYIVEWSTLDTFSSGSVRNATLDADSVPSERLPSYNSVDEEFNYFLIEGLNPGVEYFVRISAVNKAGAGPTSRSRPLSLAPGSKPTDIDDQNGVIISTMAVDTANITVEESSSSLLVSWRSPFSENGFGISKYLIEYWVESGVDEVQEIVLQSENGLPARGTFALGYGDEKTSSLSVDSSGDVVKAALESLNTIREVNVWRSGENPEYKWTVTFVSPSIRGYLLRMEDSTEMSDSSGDSPIIQINVLTPGVLPIGYMTKVVTVVNQSQKHYSYILTGLTSGQPYSVQVSAINELGYGRPQTSIPRELAPPVQKPSSPMNVNLSVASSQSLEIIFSRPKSDGGETISFYRIEWDPRETFDSLNNSPIGSYTLVSGCEPCKHELTGLVKGLNYYVRVYAYNSYGYSVEPGLPTPRYLSPKTTPDPPRYLHLSPKSDTEIEVSFPREVNDDGGAPVTKYKIEWNLMGYFAGMPSMNTDHISLLYSQHNVQSITLSAEDDDLGGTFRIAFGGHATDEVSVKSTAHEMKRALESLPTVGTVVVSREYIPNGVTWAVTFLINHGNDDRYGPGPIESLTVSVDPTDLPNMFATFILGSTGSSLIGTGARIAVKEEVTAFKGYEQQTLTMQCGTSNGILSGHFSLTFEGARTKDILNNATAKDLKLELESIASLGKVQISRRKIHGKMNSFQWSIIFLDRLGNAPMLVVHDQLICSDGSSTPLIFVTETSQSVLPRMDGLYAGNVELKAADFVGHNEIVHLVGGLRRGMPYHFRVSAYNGAGKTYGKSQYCMPSTLTPVDRPDPPTFVEMSSIDNTTIQIKWDAALAKGGSHNILQYKVELAEKAGGVEVHVQSFDVTNTQEIQEIILESSADDMEGHITVQFMGEFSSPINTASDASDVKQALEGLSTIGTVDVSIFTHTQDSMSVYGRRWVITFTSLNGNLPFLLVDTGSGPSSTMATGGTLLGSSSIARVQTVLDGGLHTSFITPSTLSPKKTYISRVQAFNGHSWSDPATSRYSISPTKVAPSPPREVRVNVLSDTTLGVSWVRPLFSGGDPIASYRVEWDSDSLFDHSSQLVPAMPGKESYFSVITNLGPNESFYVRVLSYSAMGFSEPRIALPLLSNSETISISLIASNAIELTETFALEYSTSDGFSRVTDSISVFATPNEIADELNQFAHVSVDREDHSSIFDSSGIETNVFSILYRITFFCDKSITLFVVDDNLGEIVATII